MENEPLRDIRYCVQCGIIGRLTQAGRCSTCGSEAVCLPANNWHFQAVKAHDVFELEKLLKLKSE